MLSIFPQMVAAVARYGVLARAQALGALRLRLYNPRDFTTDPHRSVDDRPYGGGAGMLMTPAPLAAAIDAARRDDDNTAAEVVYLSPQGEPLRQAMLHELAAAPALILLAGRYEGIDERIVQSRVSREISLGDYVLAGGELAALVLAEGIARLLPGVLGNQQSAREDSFAVESNAATATKATTATNATTATAPTDDTPPGLLDHPHYTRPPLFEGIPVPPVLLTGDHAAIARWRRMQALGRTARRRPDILAARQLTPHDHELLTAYQLETPGETP